MDKKVKFEYYKFVFLAKLFHSKTHDIIKGGVFRLYFPLVSSDEISFLAYIRDLVDAELLSDGYATYGTVYPQSLVVPYTIASSYVNSAGQEGQWIITIEPLYVFENELVDGDGHITVVTLE